MNKHLRTASVYGPVLALLLIGAVAYIITVKLTTPKVTTLSAIPDNSISQSTISAQSSPSASIQTQITIPTSTQLEQWQLAGTNGKESWRLDPLATAQHQSLDYGFASSDSFTLTQASSNSATIVQVTHNDSIYHLTMYQPGQTDRKGIWIIKAITQN
jgi:hypothetical protein